MNTIGLSAGHTNVSGMDQGAVSVDRIEGKETVIFRNLVASNLIAMGCKVYVDPDNSATGATVRYFATILKRTDFAIDFHFDSSANKTATGTTAIVADPSNKKEQLLGRELTSMCSKVLGIKNRGIIPQTKTYYEATLKKKLAWFKLSCNRLIFELCFISNESDWDSYQANKKRLATETAILIFKYLVK